MQAIRIQQSYGDVGLLVYMNEDNEVKVGYSRMKMAIRLSHTKTIMENRFLIACIIVQRIM